MSLQRIGLVPALALLLVVGATPPAAAQEKDPVQQFRDRVNAARLRNLPAPPPGVRDLAWQDMSPPDWRPTEPQRNRSAAQAGDQKAEDRPHSHDPLPPSLQLEWQRAPALETLNGAKVRLTGFAVVPDNAPFRRTMVLAPYYGACTDRPAPPANQMALVSLRRPLPKDAAENPLWVIGTLVVLNSPSVCGRVTYFIADAEWQPYPAKRFSTPEYRLPY